MLRSIGYEYKKIRIGSAIIIFMIILIIGNIGISFLYNESKFSSKEVLEEERQIYVDALNSDDTSDEEIDSLDGQDFEFTESCQKEIAIIDYCIKNNLPYKQVTVFSNLAYNKILINMFVLVLMGVAYSFVAVEDENNTWKNLIIANKNRFGKIYIRKKIASYLSIIVGILILILVAVLYGLLVYRNYANVNLSYQAGEVVVGNYNSQIGQLLIALFFKGLLYSSIAFILACAISKSRIAVTIPVVLLVFESGITSVLDKFTWTKVLPFAQLKVLENFFSYGINERVIALVYMVIFIALIEIGAYFFIRRKGLIS